MLQTFRFACRMLRKNPGFTLVAVCSLAIGIGATSAMFSWADTLLLRPLPVLKPSEIVNVRSSSPSDPLNNVSYRDYIDFRDRNSTLDGLIAYSLAPFGLSKKLETSPRLKYGLFVSGNFFRVLGVEPVLGRGFRADEDKVPGRDAVVVLSHDLWSSQFGADRSVIGRKLRLNGVEFTVVGVAPEHFTGVDQYFRPALFVPIAISPRIGQKDSLEKRDVRWLNVKGRLKPGVTTTQAQADLASIASALERMYPHFVRADVRAFKVSRVREVFPVATLRYSQSLPPIATSVPGVFALNSTHIVNGTLNVNETLGLVDLGLAALDATVEVRGTDRARTIPPAAPHRLPADTPHVDPLLAPGHLITADELLRFGV